MKPCRMSLTHFIIVTLTFSGTIFHTHAQLSLSAEQSCQTPFIWSGDTINGQWEPYAAMLVPVRLPASPTQFYMQFDLGATVSMLYREPIQAIHEQYPQLMPTVATTVADFHLEIGEVTVTARRLAVEDGGDTSSTIIGTIGIDFIKHHSIVIDYPRQLLTIGAAVLQEADAPVHWEALEFQGNRLFLPAVIGGKPNTLYFDSGSSAFELIASRETAEKLACPQSQPQTYDIRSWYGMMKAYSYRTEEEVTVGGLRLPILRVTWMEGADKAIEAQLRQAGIDGMVGNKLFLSHRLWLNLQDHTFALTP